MKKEKIIYTIKAVLFILLFLGAVTYFIDVVSKELNTIPMGNVTNTELNVMYHVSLIASVQVVGTTIFIYAIIKTFATLINWDNTIDYVDIYPSEETEVDYTFDNERPQDS